MTNLMICLIVLFFDLSVGSSTDLYFVNRTDFKLILPKVINANKMMRLFTLCGEDACRVYFSFQCLKFMSEDSEKLVNVFDLAVYKRNLLQNQSEIITFDLPNLERCYKSDLEQKVNRLVLEVQFSNSLLNPYQNSLKHRFDLTLSSYAYVKIITDQPVYKSGQLIKFLILPFNLDFEPFTQLVAIKLLTPNKQCIKKFEINYFAHDQLNRFEYKLSNLPISGLWTIEANILNQIFRRSFFVINQQSYDAEVFIKFKDSILITEDEVRGSIVIRNVPDELDAYLMRCSIFLVFKDYLKKQEVQTILTKFTIKELTIENVLVLDLNSLLESINRSKLIEFLNPKHDLTREAYLSIQADLLCKDETNCSLNELGERTSRNIKIIQKSKYIYCPPQLQLNHSLVEFTIEITCWLIKLIDDEVKHESNEQLIERSSVEEVIVVQSWIRTYSNYLKIPFKTTHLRVHIYGNAVRFQFSLSLLEKLARNELKNILSIEFELKLENDSNLRDYRERFNLHFYHSNPMQNLMDRNNRNTEHQIKLIVNRHEAKVNDTITLHIESSTYIRNIVLVMVNNGQLLNVSFIDTKTRIIRIKENMYPYLQLTAYAHIDDRLIYSKTSLKINRRSSTKRLLTSFNRPPNSSQLTIKLWSESNKFVHIKSLKRDLYILEQNLNCISGYQIDDTDLISSCHLIEESFDKCINHFKYTSAHSQINTSSLSTAVENLFFNHTKPFSFDILFYKNSVEFLKFLEPRTLMNSDFEESLAYKSTEYFSHRNSAISTYERTYSFQVEEEIEPEVYYLDFIELNNKEYQVERMSVKNLNRTELIRAKLLMNSRMYVNEWTNGRLTMRLDDGKELVRIVFENEGDYKVSKLATLPKYSIANQTEFNENAKKKIIFNYLLMPLRTGNVRISIKIIYRGQVIQVVRNVLVIQPGFKYNFFTSRSFELIENFDKSMFFTVDLNQLLHPMMKKNLLKSDARLTLINDFFNFQKSRDRLGSMLESDASYQIEESSQTGCLQVALSLAIEFVNLKLQKDFDSQNVRKNVERTEFNLVQLLAYYNAEKGYFSQMPGQPGNLFITSFVIDLILQLKQESATRYLCQFHYGHVQMSLRWIAKQSTSLFNNLFNNQLNRKSEPEYRMNDSIELFSTFTTFSQVLITMCAANSISLDHIDSSDYLINLDDRINFDAMRSDQNLYAWINQTISNNTRLLSVVDLTILHNEFSSLIVYSLFKCKNAQFKKFYFDLIRFYTKKLDNQNYYISLNRIYTKQPFYKETSKNDDFVSHFNNQIDHSNHYSHRPRSFDSFDTLAILNTAVVLMMKLELGDYDDSLDRFYNFLNNHKLSSNAWSSSLSTYYSLRAILELRYYHYRNTDHLRKMMNRQSKQITYKQIVANSMTMIDLKDVDNFDKMTKANLELIGDPNNQRFFDREFYFEFKRSKVISVEISREELSHYKHLYLNLKGIGYFKVDLNIECYFEDLVVDSIPHIKSYNHQVDLKPIKNNIYNLTLCQRYMFDRNHSPLTIIDFHLPLQLTLKPNQLLKTSQSAIHYLPTDHRLYIQLFNLNNTLTCISIELINDLPFENSKHGYFYSKIYDFKAGERFNLTSGQIYFPTKGLFEDSSKAGQSSESAFVWLFLFISFTIFYVLF